jgi:late competence protein required for DNA uptake (superfamily II DNA/RNA helicase)
MASSEHFSETTGPSLDRDEAIQRFKQGVFPVMIATSVAARGLGEVFDRWHFAKASQSQGSGRQIPQSCGGWRNEEVPTIIIMYYDFRPRRLVAA